VGQRIWETESFRAPRPVARPFLKWAGSKRSLLPSLVDYVGQPEKGHAYYEPFLGSGALFFALSPDKAVLSDVNWPLVTTFKVVKNHVSALIAYLTALPRAPTHDQYYLWRKRYNALLGADSGLTADESIEIAALLIWLNHTCFNGLYRVNSDGKFNVPIGSRSGGHIYSSENLHAASATLRRSQAELYSAPYEIVLSKAGRGDVAYLDPPYEPLDDQGNFTSYSAEGFTTDHQVQLADFARTLVDRGCHVVLSNSSVRVIHELYREFDRNEVLVNRMINCDGDSRGPVTELIIVGKK
jgi:DNA adenine methylase